MLWNVFIVLLNTTKNQKQTNKNFRAWTVTCLQPQVTTPNFPQLLVPFQTVSPDTTPTEAAAVILLERSLSNHHQPPRPRHAHSCNFCVFSSCWFSTSILIPAHGIAHLGIPYYESFCGQHWDCCPPEALLHGEQAQTGNSEQPDGSGGAVSRLSNGPTLLTLPPWTFALPVNLRSLPH